MIGDEAWMAEEDDKIKTISIQGGVAGGGLNKPKGGDLVFATGEGNEPIDISCVVQKIEAGLQLQERNVPQQFASGSGNGGEHGEIRFYIGGISKDVPALRIDSQGKFWLHGKEIGEDREILVFFRGFLSYVAGGMNRPQAGW